MIGIQALEGAYSLVTYAVVGFTRSVLKLKPLLLWPKYNPRLAFEQVFAAVIHVELIERHHLEPSSEIDNKSCQTRWFPSTNKDKIKVPTILISVAFTGSLVLPESIPVLRLLRTLINQERL